MEVIAVRVTVVEFASNGNWQDWISKQRNLIVLVSW